MGGTIGNINVRVGADASQLSSEMKKAQNTILTFKNESMTALKSFGLPNINSTNLVESIQSGQRVIVNFAQESGESLTQFQQRVRATFEEAGIDIAEYEKVLADADKVHAEFAKGALKSFQAVSAGAEDVNNKAEELRDSLGQSFTGINANFGAFRDAVSNAFSVLGDNSASAADKFGAVSNAVVDGFGLMTGAAEIFIGLEIVNKVHEWINALEDLAAETQDTQARFLASMGSEADQGNEFVEKLGKSYGINPEDLKGMMGKEYMNTRMLGFDPSQSEQMSQNIMQLSYDLGKLRGEDPSSVFEELQRGMEGQTRGLMRLGISISSTDLKNRALSEGLIKQGQTMDDQTKALVAYQEIMQKLAGVQGYYATTTNDLSTQQARLNAGWQEMKEKLAESLTPAFTEFYKVLNWVAGGFEIFVEKIAVAIQYTELFIADAYSAIKDVLSGNFGQINQDWQNNYNAIFNSGSAAQEFGAAMDQANNASDNAAAAANKQAKAQKGLHSALKANTMSFDQLHNITNSGTSAAQAQATAVNNLANALGNLNDVGNMGNMGNISDNHAKGIVIPVSFKVSPMPPLPPPPAVTVSVVDKVSPVMAKVKAELTAWEKETIQVFNEVQQTVAIWEVSTVKSFNTVQETITGWERSAVTAFGLFTTALGTDFNRGFNEAAEAIRSWEVQGSADFSTFASNAETSMSTFATQFRSDFNLALTATESMVTTWAARVEQSFTSAMKSAISSVSSLTSAAGKSLSSIGSSVGNWVNQNKSWLAPLGAAAGAVGLTIATGGTDLIAGGIAAAGSALAGIGGSLAVPALATGGIVTAPTLAMIGEGKGPEAVIPLDKLSSMMGGTPPANAGEVGQSGTQPIQVMLQLDGRTLARALYSYTVNENDRVGKVIGYNGNAYNYPK